MRYITITSFLNDSFVVLCSWLELLNMTVQLILVSSSDMLILFLSQ